jgi:hypothetical protein
LETIEKGENSGLFLDVFSAPRPAAIGSDRND